MPISLSGDNKGITVRGVTGQTQNLQEWQNNSGTALTYVDSAGTLNAPDIVVQNIDITGEATINTLEMSDDLNAQEIFAVKATLSGATGLVVQNESSLEGDVNILGSTDTKNLTVSVETDDINYQVWKKAVQKLNNPNIDIIRYQP